MSDSCSQVLVIVSRSNELVVKRSWREVFITDGVGIPKGARQGEFGLGNKRDGN